jgi:DNA-binding transcriptional LysR family regulator
VVKRVPPTLSEDRSIDFRLLECLQTLVDERHVSKAAQRLGMTQPKLSHVLARLRQITGDPLLVRTPTGMVPTELARELAAQASDFLTRWRSLVASDPNFSPQTSQATFNVQTPDFLAEELMVPLLHELRIAAPDVTVSLSVPAIESWRERLETGELDLALGYLPHPPTEFYISQLITYEWVCIAAADHPRVGATPDLEQFLQESHIVLSFGRGHEPSLTERYVEGLLAERNMRRKVAVYAPSGLVVPALVANTDLIALIPKPLAHQAALRLPVKIFMPPFALQPQHISMVWHARTQNDPAHRWLRALLRQVAARSAPG